MGGRESRETNTKQTDQTQDTTRGATVRVTLAMKLPRMQAVAVPSVCASHIPTASDCNVTSQVTAPFVRASRHI